MRRERKPQDCRTLIVLLVLAIGLCFLNSSAGQAGVEVSSLQGDLTPVRDPAIMRQGKTYYLFSTDPGRPTSAGNLPIRCSEDLLNWRLCGHVFSTMPSWAQRAVPKATNLWAPDISFFNGIYHLYYSASAPGVQQSVIGLATNKTLDSSNPAYGWEDHGLVLASHPGDDFNAIDANILVDRDRRIWLTYGSSWSGIKQREVDPATGMLLRSAGAPFSLAFRPDHRTVEGPSLLFHGGFYYLLLSFGSCCNPDLSKDDYRESVGRSESPHGPFVGREGHPLMRGAGTVLLEGNADWVAPGGGTAWTDAESGETLIVFHALDAAHKGRATLRIKPVHWQDGWPVLN